MTDNLPAEPRFERERLPYHSALAERHGVDRSMWRVLVESTFPNARTPEAVVMALRYCTARKLDILTKPVHIVPIYDANMIVPDGKGGTKKGGYRETVWPSIALLRITAFRTGQYAGREETVFGPEVETTFTGEVDEWSDGPNGRRQKSTRPVKVNVRHPEWGQITVYRKLGDQIAKFVGPKVRWLEEYGRKGKTKLPNEMWERRPYGQFEKVVEASSLRGAFPEEIGNDYAAEEMEGREIISDARDILSSSAPAAPEAARRLADPPPPPRLEKPAPVAVVVQGSVARPAPKPVAGEGPAEPPHPPRRTAAPEPQPEPEAEQYAYVEVDEGPEDEVIATGPAARDWDAYMTGLRKRLRNITADDVDRVERLAEIADEIEGMRGEMFPPDYTTAVAMIATTRKETQA